MHVLPLDFPVIPKTISFLSPEQLPVALEILETHRSICEKLLLESSVQQSELQFDAMIDEEQLEDENRERPSPHVLAAIAQEIEEGEQVLQTIDRLVQMIHARIRPS